MATYSAQTDKSALALLGRRMAAFRIRSNWTQAQLAEALGVERATVTMWELGNSWPSVRVMPQIADLLVCSIDDMTGEAAAFAAEAAPS